MGSGTSKSKNVNLHKKNVSFISAEEFDDMNLNFNITRDLSKVVTREPLLMSLNNNRLYRNRSEKSIIENLNLVYK